MISPLKSTKFEFKYAVLVLVFLSNFERRPNLKLREPTYISLPLSVIIQQAGTTCGASSQADLTQNLVLKTFATKMP